MQKITLFLAGGNGFIGKHIKQQLSGVYDILAPKSSELDLTDPGAVLSFFQAHPVDIVINAAAIGVKRDHGLSGVAVTNLTIFFNLISAKPYFSRMITLGSGAEYDKREPLVQVPETAFGQRVPVDEYGFSKYVCSQFAQRVDYITHLRVFGVFGSHEDYTTRFISNIICKALFGLPLTMKRRSVMFDYLWVDDLVRIIDRCIQSPPDDRCLNVGSGLPMDLYAIAEKIRGKIDKSLPIVVQEESTGNEYTPSIDRFKAYWPEFMPTDMDSAIETLIAYYKEMLPSLSKEVFE